jgi:hypothetical protein
MADFLVALAEVIDKKLWRELGYSSPFYYVRREFKLCAGAAQNRITAAELILWVPEIEPALRSGQLYLSTVTVVAKVLTSENKAEVLPRFFGLSRREAEQVAVSICPAEVIPVRDVVTPIRRAAAAVRVIAPASTLPTASTSTSPAAEAGSGALAFHMDETAAPVRVAASAGALQVQLAEPNAPAREAAVVQLVSEPARDEVEPLDAKLSRLHITVDDELLQLLEAAKNAFAHSFPSGRAAEVIKHGLRVALAQHDKRHAAEDAAPVAHEPHPRPREARGPEARRRQALRVDPPVRRALRLPAYTPVRSHQSARARGQVDARERSPPLSFSQSSRRTPGVRGRADRSLRAGPFPGAAVADPRERGARAGRADRQSARRAARPRARTGVACDVTFTRLSCADRAAPLPADGTGPRPAPRLKPAQNRSPAVCERALETGRPRSDQSSTRPSPPAAVPSRRAGCRRRGGLCDPMRDGSTPSPPGTPPRSPR